MGLSRYRYHRSLIVSSTRPLRTIMYFRFLFTLPNKSQNDSSNHATSPTSGDRTNSRSTQLRFTPTLHYYPSVDGGFPGAPTLVSGHMHWTKTIIDDIITGGRTSTIAKCSSRLLWQLCCSCALGVNFPSCNVSGPLLYLLICLLLRLPWSPMGPLLLLRFFYCRYSYLRLNYSRISGKIYGTKSILLWKFVKELYHRGVRHSCGQVGQGLFHHMALHL